jgi:hypothetical protein
MRKLKILLLLFSASLVCTIVSAQSPTPLISLPQDFNSPALLFQEYSVDTGLFTPLAFAGIQSLGNGDIVNIGPTYADPSFFPYIALDSSRNILLLHPGTFATVRVGSALGTTVASAGSYEIAGAFARANDFQNAGDGVLVVVFVNSDIGNPLFEAVISSNNAVNPNSPFTGTGVAPFDVTVTLAAADVVHFVVFSGPTLADGTFDVTALRATITSHCQETGGPCITNPQDGASPLSQFVALSGTGTAGDRLDVLVDGTPIGSNGVLVDSEGNWEALAYVWGVPTRTVQVQDRATSALSNAITVHPPVGLPSPGVAPANPANLLTAVLPLRHADILVTASATSPQHVLYGPDYTHAALYLGGDANGTPLVAEAVPSTDSSAQAYGQVRWLRFEASSVWTEANRVSAWHPRTALTGSTRDAIVAWAKSVTSQGLPYWNTSTLLNEVDGADVLLVAFNGSINSRFTSFLNLLNSSKNSTSTFICSTLVWRAYYEGTGHALDISSPNNMTATPGSMLGALPSAFLALFIQQLDPVLVVPQTFVTSPKLSQIF